MGPLVFAVVLGPAFFHATWNALIKIESDRLVAMALLNLACAVCAVPFVIWGGVLRLEVVPWVLVSGALHTIYFLMLIAAYRVGDLSHVYPIARGSSPLLVAVVASVFIGERLPTIGIFAVILISIGIISLTVLARNTHAIWGRATLWAMASGVMISIYTVIDGAAVRLNGDVLPFAGWLFIAGAVPMSGIAIATRGRLIVQLTRTQWRNGLGAGFLAFSSYALVLWGMSRAPVAYVSALREVSVIVAAVIGTRLMGEPFGRGRVAAASVVALGAVLLQSERVW